MRKLLNFFKKKKQILKPESYYSINGKIFAVENVQIFKYQPPSENHKVYGWTLEVRIKHRDGWGQWFTYNNKIYNSHSSAVGAVLQSHLSRLKDTYEWRIRPLYVMNDNELRDYKIDQLLNQENTKKQYQIKAWKVIEDCEVNYQNLTTYKYKKGTLFIQLENGSIINLRDHSKGIHRQDGYQLKNDLIPNGLVEEVKLEDEKWAHPHLLKELKKKLL
jgi:hypothetical protein